MLKPAIYHPGARLLIISFMLALSVASLPQTVSVARAESALPLATKIEKMPVFAQQHYLSCEYAATRAAVARWGVSISEGEFINAIPLDDNPHLGYRGYINGTFGGTVDYGIYAEPIALYLATRGFNTKLLTGDPDDLKAELVMGRPVVVWVPAGMGWSNTLTTSVSGLPFKLMPYEHAVTAYGYDEKGIFIADPGFGTYDYYGWDTFLRAWGYLGNMAMSVWPATQPANENESMGVSPYFYRKWLDEGGLQIYGYPISAPVVENGKVIQYFERSRMEYDLSGPRNQQIALGLVGRESSVGNPNDIFFKPIAPRDSTDTLWYFPDTFHSVGGAFLAFWKDKGSLNLFGYPISEPFVENDRVVQYFERARFELAPGTTDQVLLGLLGREVLDQQQQIEAEKPPKTARNGISS